jgi:hypothetical protein
MNEVVETKSGFEEQQENEDNVASKQVAEIETSQDVESNGDDLDIKIQAEIERRFQSAKDKRWSRLEKQYETLKGIVEEGEKRAAAEAELEIDILSRGERLLQKANLSNHPELLMKIGSGEYSKDVGGYVRFLEDVSGMILDHAQEGVETVSAVIQPGGGVVPTPDLQSQYEKAKKKLSPGDLNGLTSLKRDFRKKGLEIF